MSALAAAMLLASGVQGGHARAPGYETVVISLAIAAMLAGSILFAIYLRRRRSPAPPVEDHWNALAVMGELCPHGWQAHITLYGWGAPVPTDAPASRVPLVELEWKQFEEESGNVAVARRVWAPTIAQALEIMVQDRRTDMTLEEIENSAANEEGFSWGD